MQYQGYSGSLACDLAGASLNLTLQSRLSYHQNYPASLNLQIVAEFGFECTRLQRRRRRRCHRCPPCIWVDDAWPSGFSEGLQSLLYSPESSWLQL